MSLTLIFLSIAVCLPTCMLAGNGVLAKNTAFALPLKWRGFSTASLVSIIATLAALFIFNGGDISQPVLLFDGWLVVSNLYIFTALLVSVLGFVIGAFSSRYLDGESNQTSYLAYLSWVLASVQLMLLSNHWLLMIAAWAMVGLFMQPLLCFYNQRPFALLASHKKSIADRVADVLLLVAAGLAWHVVGSGTLTDLSQHLNVSGSNLLLEISAVLLVFAALIRAAMFPLHGWLIQVMEAPTPVSALLHAGVVNLSGFVLIRYAGLLEASPVARWLLVAVGLGTAVMAGIAMLTRVSVKVRLAWSTLAQMGFMLLECGLGLYTFAAIHLIGHSIYKANAFLSASSAVKESKLRQLHNGRAQVELSFVAAPLIAWLVVILVQHYTQAFAAWPWWWSAVLAFAWAPVLWLHTASNMDIGNMAMSLLRGVGLVAGLTLVLAMTHLLPLNLVDVPLAQARYLVLLGMILLYVALVMMQLKPRKIERLRRAAFAGFYLDELYTKLTLKYWPVPMRPQVNEN